MKSDTTTIDGKAFTATTHTDGTITLTPQEAPKQERKHRCGDVFLTESRQAFWVFDDDGQAVLTAQYGSWIKNSLTDPEKTPLLNIFDYAAGDYVRKQDVIAALSHKDDSGDSVLSGAACVCENGIAATRAALAKLGISATE